MTLTIETVMPLVSQYHRDGDADKLVKELNELAKKKEPHNDSGKGFATYTPGDDKYYTHA